MSDDHSKETKNEATEPKAKQILAEFAGRLTLVERMNARLRPLRPPVCTSRRLFDYFEIPDPYHPLDFNKPYKPDVGSSKLILGENRRPVAPHAKVPELKPRIDSNKPKAPQAFRPQGIPSAATREPSRTAPTPRPPAKAVQPKPNQKPEFGQRKGHAVAKLPVRPDIDQVAGGNQPSIAKTTTDSAQTSVNRSIPKPTTKTQKTGTGNMRMRRSTISNSQPVVKHIKPAPSADPVPDVSSKSEAQPVNRSPNAASGSGGLDDLFGFGNQEGRMKIPRSNPAGADAKKSRPIFDKNPVQKPDDGNASSKK